MTTATGQTTDRQIDRHTNNKTNVGRFLSNFPIDRNHHFSSPRRGPTANELTGLRCAVLCGLFTAAKKTITLQQIHRLRRCPSHLTAIDKSHGKQHDPCHPVIRPSHWSLLNELYLFPLNGSVGTLKLQICVIAVRPQYLHHHHHHPRIYVDKRSSRRSTRQH